METRVGVTSDTWWRTNADNTAFKAHTKTVFGTGGNLVQQWMSTNSSDSNRQFDYSYCYAAYQSGVACPTGASSSNTDKIRYIKDNKAGGAITQLTYDTMGRLTGASNWQGHSYAYTYDANGNRTSAKKDGATIQALTYNADNQISSSGYTFDKAGRRTGDLREGSTKWNALGQSVSRTKGTNTGSYSYAGYGQDELIQQKDSNTTKTYVWGRSSQAGIPTMEYSTVAGSATGTSIIDNDANGMPINMLSGNASQYVVFDGLGRMWGTVDSGGQVTSKYEYDPYQQLTNVVYPASASTAAAKTQTSQMQASGADSASSGGGTPWSTFGVQDELVKNWWKRGARWHDTSTGTWTSVDPITRLNDPTRANAYLYVGGDPINQFDPAGRTYTSIGGSACFVICVGASADRDNDSGEWHPTLSAGFGMGWDVSATTNSGNASSNYNQVQLACSGMGYTANGSISDSGFGFGGGASSGAGCSLTYGYTF